MDLTQTDIDNGLIAIQQAVTSTDLEAQRLHWMGKQGLITQAFKTIGRLSVEEKPTVAKLLNEFKTQITEELLKQKSTVKALELKKAIDEKIDVTLEPRLITQGHHHPIHQVIRKLNYFFAQRGFESKSDFNLEIEDEWHNFELLNIPAHHPARSMQDTFYCGDKILRTHVSAAQPRILKNAKLPLSAVVLVEYLDVIPQMQHTRLSSIKWNACVLIDIVILVILKPLLKILLRFYLVKSCRFAIVRVTFHSLNHL